MSKRPRSNILLFIYGGSVALHAALAVGAILLPKSTTQEATAIELREAVKKPAPKPPAATPPPPPPAEKEKPPPPPPRAQAKVTSTPKAEAPPPPEPAAKDGFEELGVAIGNTGSQAVAPGPGGAGGAAAAPVASARTAPAATATHKVEQLTATKAETCQDPIVRPKRKVPVAPKYTLAARQAEIEGVVRVEVTVDEEGRVVTARIVSGLGYGLDEEAIAAAKASVFSPASRCGKPVIGTVVLPFRFQET